MNLCYETLDLTDVEHGQEDLVLRCSQVKNHQGSHRAVVYWPQTWKTQEDADVEESANLAAAGSKG